MTIALPVPGTDPATWGTALNNFLEVSLANPGGTLLPSAMPLVFAATYGADPTGVTGSTTAFNDALAALPVGTDGNPYGTIIFGAGTFRFNGSTNNIGPHVIVVGQGWGATVFASHVTSGSTWIQHGPTTANGDFNTDVYGGGWVGIAMDGTNASAGTVGLDIGDLQEVRLDLRVQNFQSGSGGGSSMGIWARNYLTWSEKWTLRLSLFNNDNGCVVDLTANPVGGAQTGRHSHDAWDADIALYLNPNQNGLVVQNGCSLGSGSIRLRGNYATSASSMTSSVFIATGTVPAGFSNAGDSAAINLAHFDWALIANDGLSFAPYSVSLENGAVLEAQGSMRVPGGTSHFNISGGTFLLNGPVFTSSTNGSGFGNYADASQTTLAGTTAGSVVSNQPFQGPTFKKALIWLNGYENTTGTAQTVSHPTAFTETPVIVSQPAGFGATVTTAHVSLPTAMGAPVTGWIVVEGY